MDHVEHRCGHGAIGGRAGGIVPCLEGRQGVAVEEQPVAVDAGREGLDDEAALLIDEIFETALEFANKVPQTPDKEASPRAPSPPSLPTP